MEARVYGVPSLAVTGLQRNVIGMAFCCKKGGGQKWEQLPPPKLHALPGTADITVLRRDVVVVAGAELRLSLASCAPRLFSRDSAVLIKGVPSLAHQPAHSPQRKEHCVGIRTLCPAMAISDVAQCSSLLWPRLFRGVTPDRHAGETLCRAYRKH